MGYGDRIGLKNADIECCATCQYSDCGYDGYYCKKHDFLNTEGAVQAYQVCWDYKREPDYNQDYIAGF